MQKLIHFFERKAVELKPKIRYAWWAMGIVLATQSGIFLLIYQLQALPEWSTPFFMPVIVFLMIIMTWAWGLILMCDWFKPNRRAKFLVIEAFSAFMLALWFTSPIWGALWLSLPSVL